MSNKTAGKAVWWLALVVYGAVLLGLHRSAGHVSAWAVLVAPLPSLLTAWTVLTFWPRTGSEPGLFASGVGDRIPRHFRAPKAAKIDSDAPSVLPG
jgi:hypothetical protein